MLYMRPGNKNGVVSLAGFQALLFKRKAQEIQSAAPAAENFRPRVATGRHRGPNSDSVTINFQIIDNADSAC